MSEPTTPSPDAAELDAAELDAADPGPGELDAAGPDPDATAPSPTGHPSVDAVLRDITRVAGQPPGDQIPAFQAAHRTLQETLASIDEE